MNSRTKTLTLTATELYDLLDQARRAASAAEFALHVHASSAIRDGRHPRHHADAFLQEDEAARFFRAENYHGKQEAKMKAMLDKAFGDKA